MKRKIKMLKKRKNTFNSKINFVFISLLSMLVGYALITAKANINGSVAFSSGVWNIYLDNLVVKEGSVKTSNPTIINEDDKTSVSFKINFFKPDDYYEFEVDMVNDGKYDAMIKDIKLNGLPESLKKYITYKVTYSDDNKEIKTNYLLSSKEKDRIKFNIKFNESENLADLLDANSKFVDLLFDLNVEIIFGQATEEAVYRKISLIKSLGLDKDAQLDTGINFGAISSNTNGKGLYVYTNDKGQIYNPKNPIYYYRGAVTNNNIMFANYCWKIVRTTESGGTKLIYNGAPVERADSIPLEKDEYTIKSNTSSYLFTFNSSTKKWTSGNKGVNSSTSAIEVLVNTKGHYFLHYTISSESNYDKGTITVGSTTIANALSGIVGETTYDLGTIDSSTVIKVTYVKDSSQHKNDDEVVFWLEKEGDAILTCSNTGTASQLDLTSAFNSDYTDAKYVGYTYDTLNTPSTIKEVVDNWYKLNILNKYDIYLEDTIWCNDRSISRIDGSNIYYGAFGRLVDNKNPSLECSQQSDKYTLKKGTTNYNAELNGNMLLDYPIGLLTADEAALAGGVYNISNQTYYLYSGSNYWLMSPSFFGSNADVWPVSSNGSLSVYLIASNGFGVRPAISLAPSTIVTTNGTGEAGTVDNPYIVEN